MKHKAKGNTPNVFGDQEFCRKYSLRLEGGGMNADDIIRRLRFVFSARSDSALAHALDLASSAPSNWRQRKRPPLSICVYVAEQRGISLDWLIFGTGEMRSGSAGQVRDTTDAVYRAPSEAARRIVGFVSMWDASQPVEHMIWLEQHLKRSVPEHAEWLERNGIELTSVPQAGPADDEP